MRRALCTLFYVRRRAGLRCILRAGALIAFAGPTFGAEQQASPVAIAAFAQNPAHYLNKTIWLRDFACYRRERDFLCASGKGLDVIASEIEPSATKKKIADECGEMDGIERTAGCVFDLVLTPASVSRGQGNIVRNGAVTTGDIWIVQTTSVAASSHRN